MWGRYSPRLCLLFLLKSTVPEFRQISCTTAQQSLFGAPGVSYLCGSPGIICSAVSGFRKRRDFGFARETSNVDKLRYCHRPEHEYSAIRSFLNPVRPWVLQLAVGLPRLSRYKFNKTAAAMPFKSLMEESTSLNDGTATNSSIRNIELDITPEEDELFSLILKCNEELGLGLEFRAAGGWVRDKLLHRNSLDIDIAIDKSTGAKFAENLNKWLSYQGRSPLPVGVISLNPEQSKHLETATARLNGFDLDFVNLRTEDYASDSRIPTVQGFGTPLEDAKRRDFSANSLFYCLNTRKLEDYIGCGLKDLQRRLLRTSADDPVSTFLDDPLRVIRGIRLAAVLNFKLHVRAAAAGSHKEVLNALASKVAKDRAGQELKKAFTPKFALGISNVNNHNSLLDSGHANKKTCEYSHSGRLSENISAAGSNFGGKNAHIKTTLLDSFVTSVRAALLLQQLHVWDVILSLNGYEVYLMQTEDRLAVMRQQQKVSVCELRQKLMKEDVFELVRASGAPGSACLMALRLLLFGRSDGANTHFGDPVENETSIDVQGEEIRATLVDSLCMSREELRALILAALLQNFWGYIIVDEKKKVQPLVLYLIIQGLRFPKKDAEGALGLLNTAMLIRKELMRIRVDDKLDEDERVSLGLKIRTWGPHWRTCGLLAISMEVSKDVQELVANKTNQCHDLLQKEEFGELGLAKRRRIKLVTEKNYSENVLDGEKNKDRVEENGVDMMEAEEVNPFEFDDIMTIKSVQFIHAVNKLEKRACDLGVAGAWAIHPLCTGFDVQKALPRLPKGPLIKQVLEEQLKWQLMHPEATAEASIEYIKKKFAQFN